MVRVLAIPTTSQLIKEYTDPNWELDIPCTMSAKRIQNPYKQNMKTMFDFTKNNLKDIFFMHQISDCRGKKIWHF